MMTVQIFFLLRMVQEWDSMIQHIYYIQKIVSYMQKRKVGNVRAHRQYRRISITTPDQQMFIKYLKQRNYTRTLHTFQQQLQHRTSPHLQLLQTYDHQANLSVPQFEAFLRDVMEVMKEQHESNVLELVFLLHVRYCGIMIQCIPHERLALLKDFISSNGSRLGEIPVLLPYFALPYVDKPLHHPFLKRIGTQEWQNDVRKLLDTLLSTCPQSPTDENQWLPIIKDLIQISIHLQRTADHTTEQQQMMDRVHKYKQVLKNNEISFTQTTSSIRPSELSRLAKQVSNNPEFLNHSIHSLTSLTSLQHDLKCDVKYEQLNYKAIREDLILFSQNIREQNLQMSLIFHGLNNRILSVENFEERKKLVEEYIEEDILLLKQQENCSECIFSIQSLKLCQTICMWGNGKAYLSRNRPYISSVCGKVIEQGSLYVKNLENGLNDEYQQELLCILLGLLQKISIHKDSYQQIFTTQCFLTFLLGKFIYNYKILSSRLVLYLTALLMNINLHRSGKSFCCKFSFNGQSLFQLLIQLWLGLGSLAYQPQNITEIQSFIYSILYMLLSTETTRVIAKRIEFRELLLGRMLERGDDYHEKIVEYMMKQMESSEDTENEQTESEEDSDESSVADEEVDRCLWVGSRMIEIDVNHNIERMLEKYYLEPRFAPIQGQNQPLEECSQKAGKSGRKYDPSKYTSWRSLRESNLNKPK